MLEAVLGHGEAVHAPPLHEQLHAPVCTPASKPFVSPARAQVSGENKCAEYSYDVQKIMETFFAPVVNPGTTLVGFWSQGLNCAQAELRHSCNSATVSLSLCSLSFQHGVLGICTNLTSCCNRSCSLVKVLAQGRSRCISPRPTVGDWDRRFLKTMLPPR